MAESGSDQVAKSPSNINQPDDDFDMKSVKEATSFSKVGLIIGGSLFALYIFLLLAFPPNDATLPEAATEEVPMAEEEPMATEPAVEAAEAMPMPPPPLGDYTLTFTGEAPRSLSVSEDGTYVFDSGGSGTWSYDPDGVWCLVDANSNMTFCFVKLFGSDENSTWRNVDDENLKFVMKKKGVFDAEEYAAVGATRR